MLDVTDELIRILRDNLQLGERADDFDQNTKLFGSLPEFDSMAVVAIIGAIEDQYGCEFDDEEITAEVFETVGGLARLIESKLD